MSTHISDEEPEVGNFDQKNKISSNEKNQIINNFIINYNLKKENYTEDEKESEINKINEINDMNEINKINNINDINQINQINRINRINQINEINQIVNRKKNMDTVYKNIINMSNNMTQMYNSMNNMSHNMINASNDMMDISGNITSHINSMNNKTNYIMSNDLNSIQNETNNMITSQINIINHKPYITTSHIKNDNKNQSNNICNHIPSNINNKSIAKHNDINNSYVNVLYFRKLKLNKKLFEKLKNKNIVIYLKYKDSTCTSEKIEITDPEINNLYLCFLITEPFLENEKKIIKIYIKCFKDGKYKILSFGFVELNFIDFSEKFYRKKSYMLCYDKKNNKYIFGYFILILANQIKWKVCDNKVFYEYIKKSYFVSNRKNYDQQIFYICKKIQKKLLQSYYNNTTNPYTYLHNQALLKHFSVTHSCPGTFSLNTSKKKNSYDTYKKENHIETNNQNYLHDIKKSKSLIPLNLMQNEILYPQLSHDNYKIKSIIHNNHNITNYTTYKEKWEDENLYEMKKKNSIQEQNDMLINSKCLENQTTEKVLLNHEENETIKCYKYNHQMKNDYESDQNCDIKQYYENETIKCYKDNHQMKNDYESDQHYNFKTGNIKQVTNQIEDIKSEQNNVYSNITENPFFNTDEYEINHSFNNIGEYHDTNKNEYIKNKIDNEEEESIEKNIFDNIICEKLENILNNDIESFIQEIQFILEHLKKKIIKKNDYFLNELKKDHIYEYNEQLHYKNENNEEYTLEDYINKSKYNNNVKNDIMSILQNCLNTTLLYIKCILKDNNINKQEKNIFAAYENIIKNIKQALSHYVMENETFNHDILNKDILNENKNISLHTSVTKSINSITNKNCKLTKMEIQENQMESCKEKYIDHYNKTTNVLKEKNNINSYISSDETLSTSSLSSCSNESHKKIKHMSRQIEYFKMNSYINENISSAFKYYELKWKNKLAKIGAYI
ncbi:conserved Plasmodium protein, unknown function [Plasmodium sp. gorilla clade G2]|uniref:conserved Plasmodium protein, unknown function n=1 Tax=Plasmodium sp. gorilla clade G2 TaxID=880535 RepID=UPI000D22C64E|nr:conserved Plasmodium protein, unknown function [Plasmodium sp. gorilla clade G2]SOV12815.1 conserved Plasmodium protein, unknown function [Plasmodium sp. gorilla clade G2]